MIFILFSLIADSTDIDTTQIDSIKTYQVPEIFNYNLPEISGKTRFQTATVRKPEPWDFDILDFINSTGFYPFYAGSGKWLAVGSTGRSTRNIDLYINSRRIYDPFHGYADLLWFAPGMIEIFSVDNEHGIMPAVNIITRSNQGECPLSSLNYWGGANGTTLFNISYSRPFNNQLGVYMNGYYDYGAGEYNNSNHRIYRFYMNGYFRSLLRTDFMYYTNEFGFPGTAQDTDSLKANIELLDLGIGLGTKNNKFLVGITGFDNRQLLTLDTLESRYLLLSLQNTNYLRWKKLLIEYGFDACYNRTRSWLWPGTNDYRSVAANINATWNLNDFVCQIKNRIENVNEGTFYIPNIILGYTIGKATLFSRAGRYVRIPASLETDDSYYHVFRDFYHEINGNPHLTNENMWGGEIGLNTSSFEAKFYNFYYDNRIIMSFMDPSYPISFENIHGQNTCGLALNCDYSFHMKQDTISCKTLALIVSAYADHCLIDDNIIIIGQPRTYVSTGIGIKYESERLGFTLMTNGRYVGERNFGFWSVANSFFVISPVLYLRFIALSASLRIENILDQDYKYIPDYPMPGRHILFGIKWDFRN